MRDNLGGRGEIYFPSGGSGHEEMKLPWAYARGIFSPQLSREQNPSEAETSSHSSSDLRPRFSAKGDENYSRKKMKNILINDN